MHSKDRPPCLQCRCVHQSQDSDDSDFLKTEQYLEGESLSPYSIVASENSIETCILTVLTGLLYSEQHGCSKCPYIPLLTYVWLLVFRRYIDM